MSFLKELPDLVASGIISPAQATAIEEYFEQKAEKSPNRQILIFGILGALLVGLGIILILAHNWDELPRAIKTSLAFIPLLGAQVLCYRSLQLPQAPIWKEGAAAFLFLMIGASISLISQIYQLGGEFSTFLRTWLLLSVPMIYLLRSNVISLMYLGGIAYYTIVANYFPHKDWSTYWILFLLAIPYCYLLYRQMPNSNWVRLHAWVLAVSMLVGFGTFGQSNETFLLVGFVSMLGCYYLLGKSALFEKKSLWSNAFLFVGTLGTIAILVFTSFDWYWRFLGRQNHVVDTYSYPEIVGVAVASLLAVGLLAAEIRQKRFLELHLLSVAFIWFGICYIASGYFTIGQLGVNVLLVAIGLQITSSGAKSRQLGTLNFGLLVLCTWICCRFFDTDLSFYFRGLIFLGMGVGLFLANYLIIKKGKVNDQP